MAYRARMRIQMPRSLRLEHDDLAQFLAAASGERGRVGDEVRRVARLLEPHARKEEAFAMPPLGLLARLARGEVHPGMAEVLSHTDWLKNNLGRLAAEHRMLVAAAELLVEAARAAKRMDLVDFGERLINHARLEEEVLYPAAVLVGEYLRLRLAADERIVL
jgi:hypothetical protein